MVQSRLAAQEWGGGRLDELFAGAPSLTIAMLLLSAAAERDLSVTTSVEKCACSYGSMAVCAQPLAEAGPQVWRLQDIGQVEEGQVLHVRRAPDMGGHGA